ncbi:hypothetical protein BGZ65_010646, partial [Modicella reniformis]
MATCFRDAMSNLRWIQNSDANQRSLTPLGLLINYNTLHSYCQNLDCDTLIANSTTDIVVDLNTTSHFELDISPLSLIVGVNNDGIRYFEMMVQQIDRLSSKDVEFIQSCHYTHLTVSHQVPPVADNRLVDIIRNSPKLENLRIEGVMNRLINLVLSTRERAIQVGDSLSLRTFTVSENHLFKSTVTFFGDSQLFDMRTSMTFLQSYTIRAAPMIDFLRRYGWSIEDLRLEYEVNEELAALLCDSIQERG